MHSKLSRLGLSAALILALLIGASLPALAETPPTANDVTAETVMNQAVAIDVADNDEAGDYDLDLDSIVVVTDPSDGTAEVGTGGVITYTPDSDYFGADSFVYEISDTEGLTDTATVDVTIHALPIANDDTAETVMNQAVAIDVLDNDSHHDIEGDGELDPESVTVVSGPTDGDTEVDAVTGVITYTPNVDTFGADSFVYEVADTAGYTDTATVDITVHALPIANDDTAATGEEQPVAIDVLANDGHHDPAGELDPTSVAVISGPSDGGTQVDGVTGVITYTPDAGFSGTDTFVYEVADTEGRKDSAQVTISVTGAPVIASLSPESVIIRAQSFELTITGDHFVSDSVIVWNAGELEEQQLATTYVDSNTLTATIASAWVETENAALPIQVENPEHGLVSNVENFVVEGPQVWIDPDSAELVDGNTVTLDIRASANDLYGVQLKVTYDSSVVSIPGGQIDLGSLWTDREYDVLQNSVNNAAGEIKFAVSLKNPEDSVYVDDVQLATITFQFEGPGNTALEFTEAILSNRDGLSLAPVDTTDGSIHAKGTVCAYGIVELQGRPGNWAGATVTISGGPGGVYTHTFETGADGLWQICGIIEGTYDISVEMEKYLGSERTSELLNHTIGSDINFGTVRLLGGDIADDEGGTGDGVINIHDATALAADFNIGDDPRTDINDDGVTNILDAAILGGNWAKTFPVTW